MNLAKSNPEYVKAALRTRFGSVFKFEEALGLPRKSVSDVLRGRTNRRVSDAIIDTLQSDNSDDSAPGAAPHYLNAEGE